MITLAIECATKAASAALLADEEVTGEVYLDARSHHSEVVLPALESLLALAGLTIKNVDLFACTTGPGSFTGVRIGIATVKGLALATGRPIVGVSTLEALAMNINFSKRLICPLLDARKNQVYAGLYRIGEDGLLQSVVADYLGDLETVLKNLPREDIDFIGEGALRYRDNIRAEFPAANISKFAKINNPNAASLGIAAIGRYKRDGVVEDALSLLPTYLRLSEAEQKKGL
ncbi:MAG: tRNA (adenosine(37)-N6)-threonylcarbamoyltransferase complex dimerization subunit type 1 TsaB [Syntrophales bacterium]|jgi:tRNA threonylcarbamoyladenosine biosynthesis protein TsaB|nr:tRNA (adenosine(37)-N6)-threonylcarbamoyltransferase complex dimerization subunit type 1 TsaB [Syntrophales bacterium]